MNILIIGNGFDLAHGLKTNYYDFLCWAYDNGKMGEYNKFNLSSYWNYKLHKEKDPESFNKFRAPNYPAFAEPLFAANKNKTWIDLENNLAKCMERFIVQPNLDYTTFTSLFDEFLIKTFEKYIAEVVNQTEIQPKFKIDNADRVLSFNYSNTFERLYKANVPKAIINYINGNASADGSQPHIVFGCDYFEYDKEALTHFNKSAQRAYRNTDDRYKDWIHENNVLSNNIWDFPI